MKQADFTAAMMNPDLAAPPGLTDPEGRPAGRRFAVYRNNVAVSLTAALETAFPVIRALVGDEFFTAMAGVYLRAHPPTSPLMMFYGAAMPRFLAGFAPVQHLPYLPDVARLELAIRESYHAADAPPIQAEALAALPPDQLMKTRPALAPALRLVRSTYPVAAIWHANNGGPAPQMRPEDALVTRPGFDPEITALPEGGGAFVAALMAGETLGAAVAMAEAEFHNFNLPAVLGVLLQGGALVLNEHEEIA